MRSVIPAVVMSAALALGTGAATIQRPMNAVALEGPSAEQTTTTGILAPGGPSSVAPTTSMTSPTPLSQPIATLRGSGNDVVDLDFTMAEEAYIVDATHTGSSNFIVRPLNEDFSEQSSIINVIGQWIGRHVLNLYDDDLTRYLKVEADGAWTFAIRPLLAASRWNEGELHGVNSTIVLFFGSAGVVDYAYTGDSNFVVWSYGDGRDLLVNEIGPIDGTTVIGSSPSVVEIEAEGEWWLRLR